MAESASKQLSLAIAMSESLFQLAQAEAWDTFATRQQERDALLRGLFENADPVADTSDRIDAIRRILALDRQTRELLVAAREESGRQAWQTRKDHASLSAYQRVADGGR